MKWIESKLIGWFGKISTLPKNVKQNNVENYVLAINWKIFSVKLCFDPPENQMYILKFYLIKH